MKRRSLKGRSKSVRMQEVASLANVSAMTVSRALRIPGAVSEETLRRVSDAINSLGYIPNQLASSLKSATRTKIVGVIVPDVKNAIFADTLKGLSDELRTHGCSILLADCNQSPSEEYELLMAFLAQRPQAVVLHETEHLDETRLHLSRAGIPVVQIGTLTDNPIDMAVSYSNVAAGREMTRHLIGRGYRKIGFVSLDIRNTRSRERQKGYREALAEAAIEIDDNIIIATQAGYAGGARAMARLLDEKRGVDAVFFAGDVFAVGGLLECQRRAIEVPGHVAIAAFDDLELLSQLSPTVTAVQIPRYRIGQMAARSILQRLGGGAPEKVIDVGFEIIAREST